MSNDHPFPEPAPDFSDPLGLLRACHLRVIAHCDTLERLAAHLTEQGCDEEVCQAAARVQRYFSSAGQHHHEDEEQDLFPALARLSPQLADRIHHLHAEHTELDTLWEVLEPQLMEPAAIEDASAFAALAVRYAETQREHVRQEDEGLLKEARELFNAEQLRTLGQSMAARRGISPA